jgi:mannose-6-phosphate isomerase class I
MYKDPNHKPGRFARERERERERERVCVCVCVFVCVFVFVCVCVCLCLCLELRVQVRVLLQPALLIHAFLPAEMAIALTPFEALCNFRPVNELIAELHRLPELAEVTGWTHGSEIAEPSTADQRAALLRRLFGHLMRQSHDRQSECLARLLQRLRNLAPESSTDHDRLALRLQSQFPDDVGIWASYFLNFVCMAPGQALFMAANEPHAYISGDCVEAMACSDNVVRSGLTPKPKDVDTLLAMLTYRDGQPDWVHPVCSRLPASLEVDGRSSAAPLGWYQHALYPVSTREFLVDSLRYESAPAMPAPLGSPAQKRRTRHSLDLSANVSPFEMQPSPSAALLLVVSGAVLLNDQPCPAGAVFFLPANVPLQIRPNLVVESAGFHLYRCQARV